MNRMHLFLFGMHDRTFDPIWQLLIGSSFPMIHRSPAPCTRRLAIASVHVRACVCWKRGNHLSCALPRPKSVYGDSTIACTPATSKL
jgi:hypothetical protein